MLTSAIVARAMILGRSVAFSTPWFHIAAKTTESSDAPHYSVETDDYVTVLAVTSSDEFILVRQYRPAPECETLELPSGHVDPGETPANAALRELAEETGFTADSVDHLGTLIPDTGRLGNRLWCFVANGVHPSFDGEREHGVSTVLVDRGELLRLVGTGEFGHALNLAALFLAACRGRFELPSDAEQVR